MRTRQAAVQGIYFALAAAFSFSCAFCPAFADAPKSTVSSEVSDIGILGFHFAKSDNHAPEVMDVFADTPAGQSDLQRGDIITAINDVPTKDAEKQTIYQLLSGKPETKVVLKVEREGKTLTKSLIRMHSVDFAKAHPDFWKKYLTTI